MMDNSTKCVLMIGAFLFFLVYILPNLNKNTFVNSEEPQDATKPYGESIPSSMKQNRETLVKSGKDKGKINPKGFYISNCTPFDDKSFNSQFAGFEPNSKGGYDLNGYSILNNKNNNKNNNNNNNNNNKSLFNLFSKEGYENSPEEFASVNYNGGDGSHTHGGDGSHTHGGAPTEESAGEGYVKMIYTNWCGYSKKAIPDFEKLINEMNGNVINNHQVIVEMVDAETEEGKRQAKEYGAKGFPTHIIVKNGEVIKMKSRDLEGMKSEIQGYL